MPSEEVRKANALAGIERHLKDLVRIMTAVNQNLVTFAKIVGENKKQVDSETEKVLTAQEWMNELGRFWNYSARGNFEELKLTKEEFLHAMSTNGTEVFERAPKEGE